MDGLGLLFLAMRCPYSPEFTAHCVSFALSDFRELLLKGEEQSEEVECGEEVLASFSRSSHFSQFGCCGEFSYGHTTDVSSKCGEFLRTHEQWLKQRETQTSNTQPRSPSIYRASRIPML